ncbi:MAG: DUF2065 domain-containing protein [Alphaproteobacteria bacterium]|nr:DUF2065 domain-containing protein [Alphaproteobacteria bacterium]
MSDLIVGFGLVLVIEGLLWAAFPALAMKLLVAASQTPQQSLRTAGAIAIGIGVGIVWMVRG